MSKRALRPLPTLSLDTLDNIACDDLVLWVASDERPLKAAAAYVDWRANGWLSRLIVSGQFKCERGERLLTLSQGRVNAKRVCLIGLGEQKAFTVRSAPEVAKETAAVLTDLKVLDAGGKEAREVVLGVPGTGDPDAHQALLEALQHALATQGEGGSKKGVSANMTTWGPWRKL